MIEHGQSQEQFGEHTELNDPCAVITFSKGRPNAGSTLNGIALNPIEETPDWRSTSDRILPNDGPVTIDPDDDRAPAAGVLIIEPDDRVWIYEPANHFGGYEHTFPKGRTEHALTTQQTARKEALEETGLLVEIDGVLGEYDKTTTKTRYYIGRRVGGDPGMADGYRDTNAIEEVWSVKLVPIAQLGQYLNTPIDHRIAEDLRRYLREHRDRPMDHAIITS